MLALTVIALVVAGSVPQDTAVRVTGTTLRLGLADSLVRARGFSAMGEGKRQGRIRFFGMDSEASLFLQEGRLVRAEFEVADASPRQISYVEDQLTAMGFGRRCARREPDASDCHWLGPTDVHLVVNANQLRATVARRTATGSAVPELALAQPRPPAAPEPATTARGPTPAAPGPVTTAGASPGDSLHGVAVLAETLAVFLPGRPSRHREVAVLDAPRCPFPSTMTREAGIMGRVWLLALVDTDGRVIEARVTRSIPSLDAYALECLRTWRFAPVTWRGAPCRYRVEVPITYTWD